MDGTERRAGIGVVDVSPPTGRDSRLEDRARAVIASLLSTGGGVASPSYFLDLADRIESLLDATRTGSVVGGYRLVRLLGHGGSGVVYLGEREGHPGEPPVAVKLLIPGLVDAEARSRFLREGDALRDLQHPGIVRMLAQGITEDGTPFLVRERVDGIPIDRYCDEHRLPVPERLRLVVQLCDAVAYAHRQGVVHGDLKPGNVLVEPEGTVRLIDFSSAALLPRGGPASQGGSTDFATRFTPGYASPEQLRGRPLERSTDIYAAGVLLYELLTGQLPSRRRAGDAEGVNPTVPAVIPMARCLARLRRKDPERAREVALLRRTPVPSLRRKLRGELEETVQRALDPDPDRRYPRIEELAADLIGRIEEPSEGVSEIIRRHPVAAGLLGAGVAALAARGLLASRGG